MARRFLRVLVDHKLLIAILLIATTVRFVAAIARNPGERVYTDMGNYHDVAQHLMAGTYNADDTFTPIGYPAFLALLYTIGNDSFAVVSYVQAALGVTTCLLVWLIARRTAQSTAAAHAAALVVALYPPLVFYERWLLTEAIAPFWWTLTVYLLMRVVARPGIMLGVLAGLSLAVATLVRTNLLVTFPFIALFIWTACRPSLRTATWIAVVVFVSALPLLGTVSLLNSRVLGRMAGLSSNGGMNFFLLQSNYQTFRAANASWTPIRNGLYYLDTYESPVLTYDESFLYRKGIESFRLRPDKFRHTLLNLREGFGLGLQGYWPGNRLWPESPEEHDLGRRVLRWVSRAFFWAIVLPISIAGLWCLKRRTLFHPTNAPLVLALSMVVASCITFLTFLADPRVHVPFDPVLIACLCALPALLRRPAGETFTSASTEQANSRQQ